MNSILGTASEVGGLSAGVARRIVHPDPDAEPRVLLGSGFAGNQTNANATRTVAFLMQSTVFFPEVYEHPAARAVLEP
jgi:hypothetical protein